MMFKNAGIGNAALRDDGEVEWHSSGVMCGWTDEWPGETWLAAVSAAFPRCIQDYFPVRGRIGGGAWIFGGTVNRTLGQFF